MRRESKLLFTKAVDSLVLILVNRVAYDLKIPLTTSRWPGWANPGPVPRKLLIGRANHVLVSADILGNWMPRFGRTGERLR